MQKVVKTMYSGGVGALVEGFHFDKASLVVGDPAASWDSRIIRATSAQAMVIRGNVFTGPGVKTTTPPDAGALYAGRSALSCLIIEDNIFDGCEANCIYLDDCYSNVIIRNNTAINSFRFMLIGGGRNILIENNKEVNSRFPSIVDNRGQLLQPASSKGNKTHFLPGRKFDAEAQAFGYPPLTAGVNFNTSGVIRGWDGMPFSFEGDAKNFWIVS